MLEILNRVEAETGSLLAAYAWFRSEPLPGFGGATPDLLLLTTWRGEVRERAVRTRREPLGARRRT